MIRERGLFVWRSERSQEDQNFTHEPETRHELIAIMWHCEGFRTVCLKNFKLVGETIVSPM